MVRRREKKALYEVIGKTQLKSSYGKHLQAEKAGEDKPIAEDSTAQVSERLTGWPKRPRIVQFNADRVEISMSYQLAIALLLGLVLLILVVFRLGQNLTGREIADSAAKIPEAASQLTVGAPQTSDTAEEMMLAAPSAEKVELVKRKGNNRIVIQTYLLREHLEPVKQYFERSGIETEIRKIGDRYYLVTKDKYENPGRAGTDGYLTRQKIVELGAKYKAPPGYEPFAPNFFKDAYGMKFDD